MIHGAAGGHGTAGAKLNNTLHMRTTSTVRNTGALLALLGATSAPIARGQATPPAADESVTVLEKFIAEESALETSSTLLGNSRPVDSIFGSGRELLDTPRSATILTPEALRQYQLKNVYDLASVVPGAVVVNYYGVPGIPTTRGLFTSIYFNGMQRVWNRNGYPTSFGSLESMDFVKGPAPGTYSAASPGGFVNFVPKSPYFDRQRGSVRFTYGQNDEFNTQVDVGGPTLLLGKPAAYRISITNQAADSYYAGIKDDYVSIYGALKMRINDTVSIFTGGEFYRHRSKENPGWNRVTQDLIDNDNYIVGSPVNDLTGASLSLTLPSGRSVTFVNDTPGFVNRPALETATPFGGTRGNFDFSFFALPGGFSESGFRPNTVAANPDAQFLYSYLGRIDNPTARTVKLDGSQILTDAADFADADTFLYFFDTIIEPSDNLSLKNKFFVDAYKREKVSSYGYGEYGKNLTIEDKILVNQSFDLLSGLDVAYGVSARYEDSLAKTEFTVEPFNRRDISKAPTLNDTLRSGGQRATNGRTFWDPFGSVESQLLTVGVFLTPEIKFSDKFSVIMSGRWDNASWDRAVPFGLGADFNSGEKPGGGTSYTNFSISPVYKITPETTVYATVQEGTAFQGFYVSGSVSAGDTNFQESSLAETGIKTSLFDKTLFASAAVFYQELVNFDTRGGIATPQRGKGIETELQWAVNSKLTITGNLTWQQHYFRSTIIPGGFVPLTAEQIVQYAGIFTADFNGRPNPGGERYGIPEWTAGVFAKYEFGNGFGISGGPNFVDSTFANPDKTLKLPSFTLWSANVYYTTTRWELMVSAKNIFDERYFNPYDSFASNAIILKGEPSSVDVTFTYKF